jgi:hypothetical protein
MKESMPLQFLLAKNGNFYQQKEDYIKLLKKHQRDNKDIL